MRDLNIVIVNYKMKDDIETCLASLFAELKDGGLDAAVQVVDNSGNADGLEAMLKQKYPSVKYFDSGGNLGFGRAQNLGLKKYQAEYYLPLNPDIRFLPNQRALKNMINFMANNPRVGIAGPKLLNPDGSVQASCFRFPGPLSQLIRRSGLNKKFAFLRNEVDDYLMSDFNRDAAAAVDWLMGSFLLARRQVAEQIGFFDDRYFIYFEDCDWCRRAWRAGWQVCYAADIAVQHAHHRDSAGRSAWLDVFQNKIARAHLKSWAQYFLKWGLRKEHYGR